MLDDNFQERAKTTAPFSGCTGQQGSSAGKHHKPANNVCDYLQPPLWLLKTKWCRLLERETGKTP